MNSKKKQIIEQALIHLENELNDAIVWNQKAEIKSDVFDSYFELGGKKMGVVVKNEVRPTQIQSLLTFADEGLPLLIVANYITPNAKKLLQENKVNYVDRVGNMWLKKHPIYIHIDGISNQPPSEDNKNRAFTKTGVKVVFQFLLNPELLHATYREIAEMAGVSLGTIHKVLESLKEEEFLLHKTEKEWVIKDRNKLAERFQNEYANRLKPSLFVRRYKSVEADFFTTWKDLNFSEDTFWGGEPAGDLLTNHLQPEKFIVYSSETHQELMKKYRWVPDEAGEIYVYESIWNKLPELKTPKNCVHPLLVYIDLIDSGDARCIEIANMIYERYL